MRSATAARQALPTANAVRLPCAPKSKGVESVSAETTLMSANCTPRSSARTCAAPVRAAVPISAAPVFSATVPSGFTLTYTPDEPPVVVHQPHAIPLPRPTSGRRSRQPIASAARRRHSSRPTAVSTCPVGPSSPSRTMFFSRSSSGSSPRASAMMSICDSTAKFACGPEGARNEPKLVLFV